MSHRHDNQNRAAVSPADSTDSLRGRRSQPSVMSTESKVPFLLASEREPVPCAGQQLTQHPLVQVLPRLSSNRPLDHGGGWTGPAASSDLHVPSQLSPQFLLASMDNWWLILQSRSRDVQMLSLRLLGLAPAFRACGRGPASGNQAQWGSFAAVLCTPTSGCRKPRCSRL